MLTHIVAARRLTLAAIGGLLLGACLVHPAMAQARAAPRSAGRLLLVFAPDENNKALLTQFAELERDTAEVNSEDVDVVYVVGDRPVKLPPPDAKTESAENLRKHYHVDRQRLPGGAGRSRRLGKGAMDRADRPACDRRPRGGHAKAEIGAGPEALIARKRARPSRDAPPSLEPVRDQRITTP